MDLYFFQWVSDLGGADTRLKDLIKLFSSFENIRLFSIPNDDFRLKEKHNIDFFKKYNVTFLSWQDLPDKIEGVGLSFCNFRIFSEPWRIKKIKDSGLKFIWSNDMMWHTAEEMSAVNSKMIDMYLYTSEFHKSKMHNKSIENNSKSFIIENYFDKSSYNFFDRNDKDFISLGKHSRPDYFKFSDDFPNFYKNLNLKNPKYKVMGITEDFKERFSYFKFDSNWELLKANEKPTEDFLNSLDLYIYNSHPSFIENQSRAIIEALLNGLPVIAPNQYNFPNQIIHGENGFLCDTYEDFKKYSILLESDFNLRKEMSLKANTLTQQKWCDKNYHTDKWNYIFKTI